jgi:protein O-GlcNAc transferase
MCDIPQIQMQLTLQQAFNVALQHQQAGQLPAAEQLYRQILAHDPQHFDALQNLAVIAQQTGHVEDAIQLFRRAIIVNPKSAEAQTNLALTFQSAGQFDDSISAARQAIQLNPALTAAHDALARGLHLTGQLDQSIAASRQSILLNPKSPDAHNNLGAAFLARGQFDDSIAKSRQAIALNPNFPEPHNNLGAALAGKGDFSSAIDAYRRALALNPNFVAAMNNFANALRDTGQLDEAVSLYRRALALAPNYVDAHNNLASALRDQAMLDESIASHRRALEFMPDHAAAHSDLLLTLLYRHGDDAALLRAENDAWQQSHAEPLEPKIPKHENDPSPNRRLRIGYVSADFYRHPVGSHFSPLLEHRDRANFEIYCYSNTVRSDDLTTRLRQSSDHWRDITSMTDQAAAALVRSDAIDILVDLSAHTGRNRLLLFARKPAPVQVTFLAYPGSIGLRTIDYRLTDPYLDPADNDDSIYPEKTIRLPHTFWCYDPVAMHPADQFPVAPAPMTSTGHITFGCLNAFRKLNGRILKLWSRIFSELPDARLILLAPPGNARKHVLEFLDSNRVQFIPRLDRAAYLQMFNRIDLGLDTYPYNGHTTSLDSLWMGVPFVTLAGSTPVSRGGVSILTNLGLPDLIANSESDYIRVAVSLANDPARLSHLRSDLRAQMQNSPLMDAKQFTADVENAYREMWHMWCAAQK